MGYEEYKFLEDRFCFSYDGEVFLDCITEFPCYVGERVRKKNREKLRWI